MRAGSAMLGCMVIREARPEDWPGIWLILTEVGSAGETLTWDATRTEARARAGWMREPPGRTVVAVDDDGTVLGSANTHPIHPGAGAHVANAGFVVDAARRGEGVGRALCRHVLEQARADGYRAMQFNAVVETNTPAIRVGVWHHPRASTRGCPAGAVGARAEVLMRRACGTKRARPSR